MAFKTRLNLTSFSRTVASVKQWRLGWAVEEAAYAAARSAARDKKQTPPGAYALLVGFTQRS